jgi:hypothetical protein
VSQSSEFCLHKTLCCVSTGVYCCKGIFRYDSVRKLLDTPSYFFFFFFFFLIQTSQNKKFGGIKSGERGDREWQNTTLCHVPVGTVLQFDVAAPHLYCPVGVFLDREFPDPWISRGGPIHFLTPRSPDLTHLDFFVRGGGCKKTLFILKRA